MDAQNLLQRMCARHGLPLTDGSRLLPLVKRAFLSPNDVRNRILKMVDNHLSRKATSTASTPSLSSAQGDLDDEVLISVARVVHSWTPSAKVLDLGKLLPDLFPQGFDPRTLDD